MASTYSPSLKLTLMGDGDQSGLWGQTTNTNLGTLLEQAITGVQSIVMSDANYTLTNFNGITNEARNAVLVVTGTNNAIRDLIPPVVEKLYTIVNNTTGGYAIRVIGASGTGVNIPNGATVLVYCDGTNFYAGNTGTAGNFIVNGTLTATTANATTVNATTVTATTVNAANATFSGAISSVSPAFTGTPTAPTASVGTNTTQIATTAFVLANVTPGGAGGFVSVQYFTTPGAITWTRPAGIKKIYVYVIGGGGGGQQSGTSALCGGGGGGCAIKLIDVTSISSISGTVGAGGAVNAAGSSSIFNSTIIGAGGGVGSNGGGYPIGGVGGAASGGDLNIPGETASANSTSGNSGTPGGKPAFFGQAGPGGGYSGSVGNGLYGGGGGGNGYSNSAGAGGDGIIVVYEYS